MKTLSGCISVNCMLQGILSCTCYQLHILFFLTLQVEHGVECGVHWKIDMTGLYGSPFLMPSVVLFVSLSSGSSNHKSVRDELRCCHYLR